MILDLFILDISVKKFVNFSEISKIMTLYSSSLYSYSTLHDFNYHVLL